MRVELTREPLSLDEAYAVVRSPELGGIVVFSGSVRDSEEGRPLGAIEYEAYESMARSLLERLCAEVESRHSARAAVFHRLGSVPAGEPSVLVAAAAAHRAEAFAACRELIDRLKTDIPIWKTSFTPAAVS